MGGWVGECVCVCVCVCVFGVGVVCHSIVCHCIPFSCSCFRSDSVGGETGMVPPCTRASADHQRRASVVLSLHFRGAAGGLGSTAAMLSADWMNLLRCGGG
jgi:hypothetical protein